MKKLTILLFLVFNLTAFGQLVKEMQPEYFRTVEKSLEGEAKFLKQQEDCNKLFLKYKEDIVSAELTEEENELYEFCITDVEDYWDVIGPGCSWYCCGGQDTLTASSELESNKGIDYKAGNAHDLNYKTAWVEGVRGYGIGEYLTYHFPPENPRITKIIIVNGYVKTEKIWRENSRVKKMKMYVDDTLYAILNLEDTRSEQVFSFEPLGYSDRESWEVLSKKPWWTMKFEIMEVYKGEKYDDTAITEIYFDGIDVH